MYALAHAKHCGEESFDFTDVIELEESRLTAEDLEEIAGALNLNLVTEQMIDFPLLKEGHTALVQRGALFVRVGESEVVFIAEPGETHAVLSLIARNMSRNNHLRAGYTLYVVDMSDHRQH